MLWLPLLFLLIVGLQWQNGAYAAASLDDADPPAHFVTGLMVREFIADAWGRFPSWTSPMSFAEDYYLHYPKVALGHWPPGFYVIQALWTGIFPPTTRSILFLIAVLEAALAFLTYRLIRSPYGDWTGLAAALALVTTPAVAAYGFEIMTEIPQALLIGAALIVYAKFLDSGRWLPAVGFGLLATCALLFKGTGVVLAPVPILTVALMGKWRLLTRLSFWLPLPIVLFLAGPWYLWAPGARHERAVPYGGPGIIVRRAFLPPLTWVHTFGWVVAILVAIAVIVMLARRFRGERLPPLQATCLAMVISGTVFPMLFAVWELRHQVEIVAPIMVLAAAGATILMEWIPGVGQRSVSRWAWTPFVLAVVIGSVVILRMPHRQATGYPELVAEIHRRSPDQIGVVLVSASGTGEGAFIAALAQQELTPERYVVRATKLLADIDWLGWQNGEPEIQTVDDVQAALEAVPLDMIVIDTKWPATLSYTPLLKQTIIEHPEEWQPWTGLQGQDRFLVYTKSKESLETSHVLPPEEVHRRVSQALGDAVP